MQLKAPIPGMSLTREPGNAPWEQPPLYNTAEEALGYYLEKLDEEERVDDLLFALEAGYPVASMVDFLTSYSVMEGYHSFDVKMLISPILHEYIMSLADAAGVEYTERMGPSKEERMSQKDKQRSKALLMKAMNSPIEQVSEEKIDQAEDMLEGEGGASPEETDDEEEMSAPLIKRRM
jgi:hypothetical protein